MNTAADIRSATTRRGGFATRSPAQSPTRLALSGFLRHVVDTMSRLWIVSEWLLQEKGREPAIEESARAANISVEETRRVMRISRHAISLERPGGESEDSDFEDLFEVNPAEIPINDATQEMLTEKIESALKTLRYRESEIIKKRYALGDGYTYTPEEVTRIINVTRKRKREIDTERLLNYLHLWNRPIEGYLEGAG